MIYSHKIDTVDLHLFVSNLRWLCELLLEKLFRFSDIKVILAEIVYTYIQLLLLGVSFQP